MNDEKKPPIFTVNDRKRLNEDGGDYDRHFLPKPDEKEEKQTDKK